MKHSLKKDYNRRLTFKKNELDNLILKAIVCNKILPLSQRLEAVKQRDLKPKNESLTRIRNRCIVTGRSRGILKKYKISRITFKRLAENGLIPGIRRGSW